jgi:O-antigen/teichoic acid export membrane protein
MSKLVKLAGETVLYGMGSILPRVLNFFLIFLHSRIFLPESYGVYTNLYAWVAFLNIIYLFGMETAYFRFSTKPGADEASIFRGAQTFVMLIGLVLTVVILALSQPIAAYFDIPQQSNYITWLAVVMFMDAAVSIPFARLRLQKKAGLFVTAKLVNVALVIGLNLYFLLVVFDPAIGIGYPILANLIANSFYLLFFFGTLIRWRPQWNPSLFHSMLQYAWPIMLMGLAGMTNEVFSRVTLSWWLPDGYYQGKDSQYALGIFGMCFRFSVIMNVVVQAFRFAAEPFFFSNATDKNSPVLFARVNHYFIIVCSFIALGVCLNLDVLKYLIGEEYWPGLNIVPYLLFGYLFLGIYYNLSIWYKLTDKTYFGTLITVFGVIVTISMNYLLIPLYGYLGSSWATLACYSAMALTSYWLGQKYYPIPYQVAKSTLYLVLTITMIVAAAYFPTENQWMATSLHLLLMGLFALAAYLLEKADWNQAAAHS